MRQAVQWPRALTGNGSGGALREIVLKPCGGVRELRVTPRCDVWDQLEARLVPGRGPLFSSRSRQCAQALRIVSCLICLVNSNSPNKI